MHRFVLSLCFFVGIVSGGLADEVIPHHQDRPPGPALSPQEAIEKMQVPDGFSVELFASEPDLVNPVSMTFDQRGRVWVVESLEYPRTSAGEGKDRVKILEDSDGDGKADKVTIFAEGLNIPSGIALGYGGAFVANAPDLLFLQDSDGDDKADVRQVLVTGFGRTDTHELPNSLIWGPDGWLYGLNGVFNYSKITHQERTHEFNCALWRYHPQTKAFELFCEGTSNPWGLDYNINGDFFVSACVIDHLWHLTQTGYYHRQAGPYPPFTWKIESIVEHKHQKAAYCGLCFYDAEAYPEEYRGKLFMGNIHGNCINSDQLQPRGASYFATPCPDFLTANDAWFMPVAQKVGPDGCLWVLDWYDRYHCYQDARRDPDGIDRLKGRLYRVVYKNTPMPEPFDLAKRSSAELVTILGHSNVYYRRWARQLLIERGGVREQLQAVVLNTQKPLQERMEALWTLAGSGPLEDQFHKGVLAAHEPALRAWGVRCAAEHARSNRRELLLSALKDADPLVRLQLAIAANKLPTEDAQALLASLLCSADSDDSELTQRIVWQNMLPHFEKHPGQMTAQLTAKEQLEHAAVVNVLPRVMQRLLAHDEATDGIHYILDLCLDSQRLPDTAANQCLEIVLTAWLNGEMDETEKQELRDRHAQSLIGLSKQHGGGRSAAMGFAVLFGDSKAAADAIAFVVNSDNGNEQRELLLRTLIHSEQTGWLPEVIKLLKAGSEENHDFRVSVLSALARSQSDAVGEQVLAVFEHLPEALRPQALDLLCSRPAWAGQLIAAVEAKQIDKTLLNGNQLRRLSTLPDDTLLTRIEKIWGKVRTERNPERERVVAAMRQVLQSGSGDPGNGAKVFERVCAQCHKLNGQGNEVGPDLTVNGRGSLEQLLSNLLDPNLVIGKDYQAYMVVTADGRVLTGLLAEDSQERIVLKVAGGKQEVVPRSEIEGFKQSSISLMPEDLEKQVDHQQFRDLIAYLLQDPPASP